MSVIVGLDETGRGTLAGTLFIGLVAADLQTSNDFQQLGIKDSKQLKDKKRFELEQFIIEKAIYSSIGFVKCEEINTGANLNDLFVRCVNFLLYGYYESIGKDFREDCRVFVDGTIKLEFNGLNVISKPKLDITNPVVSAASIIAKNAQVRAMNTLHELYPEYGFSKHNGYGTKAHYEAIRKFGISSVHRKNWIKL